MKKASTILAGAFFILLSFFMLLRMSSILNNISLYLSYTVFQSTI